MKKFSHLISLVLAFAIAIPMPAQVGKIKASDNVTTTIGRGSALGSTITYTNTVEMVARHADGTVFYHHKSHNLLTNAGKDVIASAVSNTGTQAAACNYIALTNTAITPAAGDTTLSGEITTNGLARAQAAYAHTNGTSTYTLTKTFTATATQASQAAGVFNASSAGSMCFENTYTQVTLNNTDTLTVTWTITLS